MQAFNKPIDPNTLRRAITEVHAAVSCALQGGKGRYVLAVSGGADSMVLFHAAAAVLPLERIVVATFDHGTGPAAAAAVMAVEQETSRLGIDCIRGRADSAGKTEAE